MSFCRNDSGRRQMSDANRGSNDSTIIASTRSQDRE